MSKASLGIILPGDPNCVQKQNIVLNIFSIIFRHTWIVSLAAAIITIIFAFTKDRGSLLVLGLKLLILTVVFFLTHLLWGNTVRCPYCHHFLTLKRISGNKTISSFTEGISRTEYDNHSGVAFDFRGNTAFYSGTTKRREYGTRTTETYAYNMYCTNCGCVHKVKEITQKESF